MTRRCFAPAWGSGRRTPHGKPCGTWRAHGHNGTQSVTAITTAGIRESGAAAS
jgi:hypothetical protein